MPQQFTALIRSHEDSIIRAWVEELYAEGSTDLPSRLSYEQLVDHLPDLLEELSRTLDLAASDPEIVESSKHLRAHPQVRFHQGVLIDEVARELIIFRKVFNEFLWREGNFATHGDLSELHGALMRADRFIDELIAQSVVIYAASLRPAVETRMSNWPPPRSRKTDLQGK